MTTTMLSEQDVALKLKEVCKTLGWKAEPPSQEFHHVYLKAHVDGLPCASVSLSYGRYPDEGRIIVNARTDHDSSVYRYGEKHLSIGVSATRPADQITKEIQRRFIPPFLEIAKKAQEIEKRRQEYHQRLETCLGRLKGEPLEEVERQNAKFHLHLDPSWGTVQYSDENQVNLDFHSIPVEIAERILAILREAGQASSEVSHVG